MWAVGFSVGSSISDRTEEADQKLHIKVRRRPLQKIRSSACSRGDPLRQARCAFGDRRFLRREPIEGGVEVVRRGPVRVVEIEEVAVRLLVEFVPESPLCLTRLIGGGLPEREKIRNGGVDAQRPTIRVDGRKLVSMHLAPSTTNSSGGCDDLAYLDGVERDVVAVCGQRYGWTRARRPHASGPPLRAFPGASSLPPLAHASVPE